MDNVPLCKVVYASGQMAYRLRCHWLVVPTLSTSSWWQETRVWCMCCRLANTWCFHSWPGHFQRLCCDSISRRISDSELYRQLRVDTRRST